MKELPILFSTPMVQAILAGRKTETRRKVNPQPSKDCNYRYDGISGTPQGAVHFLEELEPSGQPTERYTNIGKCPYGQPGDVLYVREKTLNKHHNGKTIYRANVCSDHDKPENTKWKPSIHMPKAAARIWLQVTEIKVERLQDIGEYSAIAEGVEFIRGNGGLGFKSYLNEGQLTNFATLSFQTLWESINGPESWNNNPWVWVVKFKVLSTTGKPQN